MLYSKPFQGSFLSYEYLNQAFTYMLVLQDVFKNNGDQEKADEIEKVINYDIEIVQE